MDDNEREYFRQQLAALDGARRRWRLATFFLLAALGLFLLMSTGTLLTFGLFQTQRLREARAAEEQARAQAEVVEQQRQAEQDQAEKAEAVARERVDKALQEAQRPKKETEQEKKAGDKKKSNK
jgi:ABC-type bacteriocin/lantibiotic exporter with double-glycine peptidase domain